MYGDLSGAAGAVWLATYVLADGKFIAIFAMLFGAGIAMLAARHEAAGLPAALPHYRRMTALLPGRRAARLPARGTATCSSRSRCVARSYSCTETCHRARLIAAGVVFLGVAPVLSSAVAWTSPRCRRARGPLGSPEAIARELAAYRGGWLLQQGHRAPTAWEFQTSYFVFRGVWQMSGLMLVGMGLFRLES